MYFDLNFILEIFTRRYMGTSVFTKINIIEVHCQMRELCQCHVWHICVKKKVKCTLVQPLRLRTGRTARRGSIALPFLDHGTRRARGVSVTPWPHFTPGKDPAPIVQQAGWAPGPVWTGAENLASHRDSIPRLYSL